MAATVGVSSLLASAFSSTLSSPVVTYEQYKEEKEEITRSEKEKNDSNEDSSSESESDATRTYTWTPLSTGQLFDISRTRGGVGDKPSRVHKLDGKPAFATYVITIKTLTGKDL